MSTEKLKQRALSLVELPGDFKPVIEDFHVDGQGRGEAFFAWANEERDEHISITLDHQGKLVDLTVDKNMAEESFQPLNAGEKRRIAEEFLGQYYPDAMNHFILARVKKRSSDHMFYFEQMAMGLPLKNAGCWISVDDQGTVTGFHFMGIKEAPPLPKCLIEKEKLLADVRQRLDFQLSIVEWKENDYRLVYEPVSHGMDYRAEALEPCLIYGENEEKNLPRKVLPIPVHTNVDQKKRISREEIIGIGEEMEVVREKDMGNERGIVWRKKNWVPKEKGLTLEAFFANKNEDTVKAFIDKETGRVMRFFWFYERKGDLCLTREECFQIAIVFLSRIIPEYCPYLQQEVLEDGEEKEPFRTEGFPFYLYKDQVPVQSGLVMVGVNRTTGLIDYYEGPGISLNRLEDLPSKPVISKEQAREQFLKHLDFKLAWHDDYGTQSQFLVYEACNRATRSPIRYIDAITGEVLVNPDAAST